MGGYDNNAMGTGSDTMSATCFAGTYCAGVDLDPSARNTGKGFDDFDIISNIGSEEAVAAHTDIAANSVTLDNTVVSALPCRAGVAGSCSDVLDDDGRFALTVDHTNL